jgi:spore maturation protein CgeB
MRVSLLCHSLLSDWNHGNAHFLRGIVGDLLSRGHDVKVYEPVDAWSVENLVRDFGRAALFRAQSAYPWLSPIRFDSGNFDAESALADSDLVLVHEWTHPDLVRRVGALRRRMKSFTAFFHDTHHRMVTDSAGMAQYDLSGYDGVLAFGTVLRNLYDRAGYPAAFTWHEAADVRVFYPRSRTGAPDADVVFIGNWGDEERTRELFEFLVEPVQALGLRGSVYGVRYPDWAIAELRRAGIAYRGWAPNFEVPEIFARHRVTIHVPRGPYTRTLPGIPTIRPFEALACGIPLISAPWSDCESLLTEGRDYLVASSGSDVVENLQALLTDSRRAERMAERGRATILARHTCAHRVNELLAIVEGIRTASAAEKAKTSHPPVTQELFPR